MHNANLRAEQYTELRRRITEMNNSACAGKCGLQRQSNMERIAQKPCNPEGDKHGNGWRLYEYPLATVYAPYQQFRGVYKCSEALEHGTLFSELYLPFEGCK